MVEITERDLALLEMILRFKMVSYEMARGIYQNKKAIYNRIRRLIKERVLKKIGRNNITLDVEGIKYLQYLQGTDFEPLNNPTSPEVMERWRSVVTIGNRRHIAPYFKNCWDLKAESRKLQNGDGISDKNKILGIANGYGIYKIAKNSGMKVLSELLKDIEEMHRFGVNKFIMLCEGQEKLKDFIQIVTNYSQELHVQALHTLTLSESGLQLMDVIVAIPWKRKVISAVYGNVMPSRYPFFDCEANGKQVHIGIDGEMIKKGTIEGNLMSGLRVELEILCLKGQEWRYEGMKASLRTITLQEFLNAVGYNSPGIQPNSQTKVNVKSTGGVIG